MKKIIFILILVLFSSIVIAGNTYKIDLSKSNNYLVNVREGDRIEFNMNDERHNILIKEIRSKNVDIAAFLNLNTQNTPMYFTIGEISGRDVKLKLDTNRDDVDDLFVWLESSDDGKAGIRLFKPIDNEITGNVVGTNKKGPSYKWILFPLIAIILLILVIIVRKNKKI